MVLASQPEYSGPLKVRSDQSLDALFFENPRNTFRTGPAFVALSHPAERVETRRGRFFGVGRNVAHPILVERGEPDTAPTADAALFALDELEEKWGKKYRAIIRLWRNAWTEFVPFLDYDVEIRRVICSTSGMRRSSSSAR